MDECAAQKRRWCDIKPSNTKKNSKTQQKQIRVIVVAVVVVYITMIWTGEHTRDQSN